MTTSFVSGLNHFPVSDLPTPESIRTPIRTTRKQAAIIATKTIFRLLGVGSGIVSAMRKIIYQREPVSFRGQVRYQRYTFFHPLIPHFLRCAKVHPIYYLETEDHTHRHVLEQQAIILRV